MRNWALVLAAHGLMAMATVAACDDLNSGEGLGNGDGGNDTRARVGVILPDTASARRWSTHDPVYLSEAFDTAGVRAEIANAGGDPENFERIGNAMIDHGVRVLIITSLDPVSGGAVLKRARREGIPTIDHDRLTLNGGADYHVGFDDEAIGRQQAHGAGQLLSRQKEDESDCGRAGRSADGLQRRTPQGRVRRHPPAEIRRCCFYQGRLNGKIPVAGHEATVRGLQNLLTGDQCVTVYRKIKLEAQTAATLAIRLSQGERPAARKRVKDPESGAHIPFFPLEPFSIDVTQVKEVVADGFVSRSEVCAGKYAKLCARYGVVDPGDRQ